MRTTAESVARSATDGELAVFRYTLIEPATGYYLSQAWGEIVPRHFSDFDAATYYISSPLQYPELGLQAIDSLYLRHLLMSYPTGTLVLPTPVYTSDGDDLRDGMGSGIPR